MIFFHKKLILILKYFKQENDKNNNPNKTNMFFIKKEIRF